MLAVLTRNEDDSGTGPPSFIDVSINLDGIDVARVGAVFLPPFDLENGHAGILPLTPGDEHEYLQSFDSDSLTNSSVRVGVQGDDAWAPQHVLLLGRTDPANNGGTGFLPLATEVDIADTWLSADFEEGILTMPIRRVGLGNIGTPIQRVLFLVRTGHGDNDGTDDPVELEITIGDTEVLRQRLPSTTQPDLEQDAHNWYFLGAVGPFNKRNLMAAGRIRLRMLDTGDGGNDAWVPMQVFIYGLDTATGRPNVMVPLVSIDDWNLGALSNDTNEGQPFIDLPVS